MGSMVRKAVGLGLSVIMGGAACAAEGPSMRGEAAPVTTVQLATATASAAAEAPPAGVPGTATVIVKARGASSRGVEPARTLRRLAAWRKGKLQLSTRWTRLSLSITEVV